MTTSSTTKLQTGWKRSLQTAAGSVVCALMLLPTSAFANDWDYAKEPLFWSAGVKPNVALMIDDSGSMGAIVAAESFQTNRNTGTNWRWCTNANNTATPTCSSKASRDINTFEVLAWDGNLTRSRSTANFTISRAWTISTASPVVDGCPSSGSATSFLKTGAGTQTGTTYSASGFCVRNTPYANGDIIQFVSKPSSGVTSLQTNTDYYIVNRTDRGYQISETEGGTPISFDIRINSSGTWTFRKVTINLLLPSYINGQDVALCNVAQASNYYIGNSGGVWNGNTLPGADELGVMVGLSNSTSRDSCVRWKMASTARSSDTSTSAGRDYALRYSDGTSYAVPNDDALDYYATHLINTHLPASGNRRLNMDDKNAFPDNVIPGVNRMQAAREAAQLVVSEYFERMNISLFSFDSQMNLGIPVYGFDATDQKEKLIGNTEGMTPSDLPGSALDGAIGSLYPDTMTPLAKTQNAINTYFKKDHNAADKGPITYRCQKNYAIIMTDGEPTSDSGTLDGRALEGYADLQPANRLDADSKSFNDPSNPAWVTQNIVPYTIGFGIENDLLKRTPLVNRIAVSSSNVLNNVITLDEAHGLKTGDPVLIISGGTTNLRYAAVTENTKFKVATSRAAAQTCVTSAGACAGVSGNITVSTGPGKSFFSFTPEQLAADLSSVFKEAENITASASGVSANSKQVGGDTLVYQAKFTTKDWSGMVSAYPITVSGSGQASVNTSSDPTTKGWTTKSTMETVDQRATSNIYTWSMQAGTGGTAQTGAINFVANDATYDALSAAQQLSLGNNKTDAVNTISWLIGNEVLGFRTRKSENGMMGDVINADPEYVGAHNFGYDALPSSSVGCSGTACTGKEEYSAFVQKNKQRAPVLFAGTNHGFVHALDAKTGTELMAYVPAGVYTDWVDTNNNGVRDTAEAQINKFQSLRSIGYQHDFFVDGTSTVGDAFIGGSWETYLVGGLGAGGRSIYAMDVTETQNLSSPSVVKWELMDADLGYTYGKPLIVRMKDGNWYAMVPNGLDSNGDVARILLIDLASGTISKRFEGVDAGQKNGMMAVQVRLDATRTVVDIYGGDIRGNIWHFDVNATSSSGWSSSGSKVFSARDEGGNVQHITGGMRLGAHPGGLGTIVYFGTGKYFENADKSYTPQTLPTIDTFYAVLDKRMGATVSKSELQEQIVKTEGDIRVMDAPQEIDWEGGQKGWYMNLPDTGERVIGTPLLYGGRVIFTTIVPSGEGSCDNKGYGWLMEVDALTGKQFEKPVLDTDGDGRISSDERSASGVLAGDKEDGGMPSDPNLLHGDVDYKLMGNTSQTKSIQLISETKVDTEGLKGGSGRMSWQQLQ